MGLKIAFVARHDQPNPSNDDEGAITHAFQELGHKVERLRESKGHLAHKLHWCDFLLFCKWLDCKTLARVEIPKVFYYFDLVTYPDPTLDARNRTRLAWMAQVLPLVDLGFCTDGDHTARDRTGKLVWLPQGADGRYVGFGTAKQDTPPILFTGITRGGKVRADFVYEMSNVYGDSFRQVQSGVHGRELADLIASSKIVVAPDGPVSDRYWSNRVYLSLGFGAFLLHPYCEGLTKHYTDGQEVVFYRSREDLHDKIRYYLERPAERQRIAAAGLERTKREHLYRHRVERLVQIVKERLL